MKELKYYTQTVTSARLGDFLNRMEEEYSSDWELIHIQATNEGYVTYVTVRVWQEEVVEAPAPTEEPYRVPKTLWNNG